MIQDILSTAIAFSGTTIVFGNLGRYPNTLHHLLNPFLEPLGEEDDYPGWFRTHDGKDLYVWIEPSFGAQVPGGYRNLIFTSHLDLKWTTAKIVYFHVERNVDTNEMILNFVPFSSKLCVRLTPSTAQPFHIPFDPSIRHFVVESDGASDVHRLYLSLLTFWDTWRFKKLENCSWSLHFTRAEKRKLKLHLKRSSDNVERFIAPSRHKEIEYYYFHKRMADMLLLGG